MNDVKRKRCQQKMWHRLEESGASIGERAGIAVALLAHSLNIVRENEGLEPMNLDEYVVDMNVLIGKYQNSLGGAIVNEQAVE